MFRQVNDIKSSKLELIDDTFDKYNSPHAVAARALGCLGRHSQGWVMLILIAADFRSKVTSTSAFLFLPFP